MTKAPSRATLNVPDGTPAKNSALCAEAHFRAWAALRPVFGPVRRRSAGFVRGRRCKGRGLPILLRDDALLPRIERRPGGGFAPGAAGHDEQPAPRPGGDGGHLHAAVCLRFSRPSAGAPGFGRWECHPAVAPERAPGGGELYLVDLSSDIDRRGVPFSRGICQLCSRCSVKNS